MDNPPSFLMPSGDPAVTRQSYRPYAPDRRGELLAWLCTVGILLLILLMQFRSGRLPGVAVGLSLFFGLAALLISFGNWMDLRTRIEVDQGWLTYRNPLRKVSLEWDQIDELTALPLRSGWRIVIAHPSGRFAFRTPAELQVGSFEPMRIGVRSGDELAEQIVLGAGLREVRRQGPGWLVNQVGRGEPAQGS